MSFGLIIEPEAEAEIAHASDWYEQERGTALRIQFLQALDAAFERIKSNPYQYQIASGGLRRAMLRRFPYSLVYVVTDRDVIVVSCFHTSRSPDYWQRRAR